MTHSKLIIMVLLFISGVFSQITEVEEILKTPQTETEDGWKSGGTVSVNLTQVSLTNWASGGQSSIATNGLLNLYLHFKRGNSLWENYLDIGYGTIRQGNNADWWKTNDIIDLTSKYGQKAFDDWYYAGMLNFKTQLTAGYNYPDDSTRISDLLAPGYFLGAVGMDYQPEDKFTAFITPITTKITFVYDQSLADAGAYGVEAAVYDSTGTLIKEGENIRSEFGGYVRLFYMRDLMENIAIQTKLDLFSNYIENPQNIDISWEVLISMKVNKYVSATLSTHLLYDDDINIGVDSDNDGIIDESGPRTQFKEVLGVGLYYQF